VNPDGYIATAGHCVDDGIEGARGAILEQVVDSIVAADPTVPYQVQYDFALANYETEGFEDSSPIDREVSVIVGGGIGNDAEGNALPAQVIDYQPLSEGDVALLKIEASELPSAELAPDADVAQGTPVLSIGYPGSTAEVTDPGLEPTFKDGQISSKTMSGSVPFYETSAAVSQGMSGGPTVGFDGRVVWVNSFSAADERQAFNFITTASQLDALLGRNNVTAELGPVDWTYREGLTQYFEGEYSDAIASFDEVLALSPDFRQAEEFRTNATRARAQFGDAGPPGWIWFAAAGGVLLVVAVLVIVLVTRRRRRAPQAPAFSGGPYGGGPGQGYGASPSWQGTPAQSGTVTPGYGIPMQEWTGTSVPAPAGSPPTLGRGCPRCGTEPASGARFCANCGSPLG